MTFASMTALELLAGYRRRAFSPTEVVTELLARAEALQPRLNAFYLLDGERALSAARASEARWMRRSPCGSLDGVPSSIKDALPSLGHVSYRGSAAHPTGPEASKEDAPAVARMREAGAVFLGKTTMPDFGILASGLSSKHGVTRNPWDETRTPGGSSAGTAASIAAGINPLAVGTDIVGSIRLPASFCGIFGLKPSQGRVPYYFPNSPSLVAGPMAWTVSDAALLMNEIARPDPRDFAALPPEPTDYLAGLDTFEGKPRIGIAPSLGFGLQPDAEVVSVASEAAEMLAREGTRVSVRGDIFDAEDLRAAELFYKVRCRTEFRSMPEDRQAEAKVIDDWSAEVEDMPATTFYRIFNRLQLIRERVLRLMAEVEFLLLPSVHIPPFAAELPGPVPELLFAPWANAFAFNLSEQPAASVPCGFTSAGLPVGLQIVGCRFDDLGVLRLARRFEALCGGFRRPDLRPAPRSAAT